MARIPEYPPILNGSTIEQIKQLREYLIRFIKILEDAGVFDDMDKKENE